MAKSSFWLRGAKGKLAGATIYDANGQSVMREVKAHIKNPRTKAQMIQRIIMKTVMNQYAAMKGICDHSFEGVAAGANSMARFATLNNNLLRERIAKAQQEGDAFSEIFNFIPLKTQKFIPASVQLSEGSLPRITYSVDSSRVVVENLTGAGTYGDIINSLGLERGDQLTFIAVSKDSNNNYKFRFARVILDPREADGTAAPLTTSFSNGQNGVNKPSFRNEGSFATFDLVPLDEKLYFALAIDEAIVAGAVIASRKENNEWLRSTQVLGINTYDFSTGDNISLQEALDRAIQGTEIYTESERYLNNAGEGGPQGEVPTP